MYLLDLALKPQLSQPALDNFQLDYFLAPKCPPIDQSLKRRCGLEDKNTTITVTRITNENLNTSLDGCLGLLRFALGDGEDLRLRCSLDFSDHTPDTVLKLVVRGSVDEWIDAAVGEHQYHGEVVEPTIKANTPILG